MGLAITTVAVGELAARVLAPPINLPMYDSSPAGDGLALSPRSGGVIQVDGRSIVVTVDAAGHRTTIGSPVAAVAARPVYVIGSSQVFGSGLADGETVPSQLQQRLGPQWRVVNLGLPGTGPIEYAHELAATPPGARVVVVFNEQDDLWATYGIARHYTTCGFLAHLTWPRAPLSCWLLNLRLFQIAAKLTGSLQEQKELAPLGFNPASRIAAHVLAENVHTLFQVEAASRRGLLTFTYVPWAGRFSAAARAQSFPATPPDPTGDYFEDDYGMLPAFAQRGDVASLYQRDGSRLSAAGAALVSQRLATALLAEGQTPPQAGQMTPGVTVE